MVSWKKDLSTLLFLSASIWSVCSHCWEEDNQLTDLQANLEENFYKFSCLRGPLFLQGVVSEHQKPCWLFPGFWKNLFNNPITQELCWEVELDLAGMELPVPEQPIQHWAVHLNLDPGWYHTSVSARAKQHGTVSGLVLQLPQRPADWCGQEVRGQSQDSWPSLTRGHPKPSQAQHQKPGKGKKEQGNSHYEALRFPSTAAHTKALPPWRWLGTACWWEAENNCFLHGLSSPSIKHLLSHTHLLFFLHLIFSPSSC